MYRFAPMMVSSALSGVAHSGVSMMSRAAHGNPNLLSLFWRRGVVAVSPSLDRPRPPGTSALFDARFAPSAAFSCGFSLAFFIRDQSRHENVEGVGAFTSLCQPRVPTCARPTSLDGSEVAASNGDAQRNLNPLFFSLFWRFGVLAAQLRECSEPSKFRSRAHRSLR